MINELLQFDGVDVGHFLGEMGLHSLIDVL